MIKLSATLASMLSNTSTCGHAIYTSNLEAIGSNVISNPRLLCGDTRRLYARSEDATEQVRVSPDGSSTLLLPLICSRAIWSRMKPKSLTFMSPDVYIASSSRISVRCSHGNPDCASAH